VSFAHVLEAFVTETTIREANNNAWGNYLVVGLGSLTYPSVHKIVGVTGAMVGVLSSK
jgi:hypothetical protein